MQLTVNDVSRFLNVSEETIYRMIRHGEIPARKIQDQYHFNRTEFLDWAMAQRKVVSAEFVKSEEKTSAARLPKVSSALKAGGIHRGLEGADRKAALRALVGVLRLPPGSDRELMLKMLLAREALASTGIGEGIALPHARNPLVFQTTEPQITLAFLKSPVDFHSLDGKPVFALFSMITPTVRAHLHLLSRLAFALQDAGFRATIRNRESDDLIFRELTRVESAFAPAARKAP